MLKYGFNVLFFILLLATVNVATAQDEEIKKIYEILDKYSKDENYTIDELNLRTLSITKRKNLVTKIKRQTNEININILRVESAIKKLEIELTTSKQIYEKLIYFSYLYRYQYNTFTFLLSAQTINQIFLRLKYLKIMATYRQNIIDAIKFLKSELVNQKEILDNQKEIKNILLENYKNEKITIEDELTENIKIIEKLKQKNIDFRKRVEDEQELHKQILQILTETTKFTNTETELETQKFLDEKQNLLLPIEKGIIIKEFGEYQHPTLTQVTIRNDGIDIAPTEDFKVRAVADGIVNNILSIPGANNAVIIKHGEYFTVYTNIINVDVTVNQKISKQQLIGYVPKDETQIAVINFQIWHLTEKQNPANWLKKVDEDI